MVSREYGVGGTVPEVKLCGWHSEPYISGVQSDRVFRPAHERENRNEEEQSISTGAVNRTDQISGFDKLNNNSAFGTFRAGQAADPRVAQLAAKVFF